MKKLIFILASLSLSVIFSSCEELDTKESPDVLSGDQSPMGAVGVTVSSSSAEIAGVSNFSAVVTALKDGISTYNAKATVTNQLFKNMMANFPGITINGDTVTLSGMKIQQTKEGIKNLTGTTSGVLVKYASEVGDSYPIGTTGKVRTVVSKTGIDEYPYGFYLIKTIQVKMDQIQKSVAILNYTFICNHKFGLVGVKVNFDDGTSEEFPVYTSAEN